MTTVTVNVNVTFSPETLAALVKLAEAVIAAVTPEVRITQGRFEGASAEDCVDLPEAEVVAVEEAELEDDAPEGGAEVVSPPRKWSPERVNTMVSLKAMKTPWTEIFDAVNALPGEKIASVEAAQNRYSMMKTAGTLPVACVAESPAATTVYKPEFSVAAKLIEHDTKFNGVAPTDWRAIGNWAQHNKVDVAGLKRYEALKKINAARANFGLPPFVAVASLGPTEALPHPHFDGDDAKKAAPRFKRRAA